MQISVRHHAAFIDITRGLHAQDRVGDHLGYAGRVRHDEHEQDGAERSPGPLHQRHDEREYVGQGRQLVPEWVQHIDGSAAEHAAGLGAFHRVPVGRVHGGVVA